MLSKNKDHPVLADFTQAMAKAPLEVRLSSVRDAALTLPQQAVAALSAIGTGARGEILRGMGGIDALLILVRKLGVHYMVNNQS